MLAKFEVSCCHPQSVPCSPASHRQTTDTLRPADKPRKFTMLVAAEDDAVARRVVDDVVRRSGVRATKSMRADVIRVLFAMADEDPLLRAAIARRIGSGATSPAFPHAI